jgi:glycosyltransferase involved in cell wall biosynthesis
VAATISLLSAQVVCVSQASAAAFAGLAPASSLSVIHTGFPASQPYAAEELPAEVREGGPGVKRVVFVGDFIECKGLPVLANAMAQVFRQSSDCRLYMAGQERRWTLADFLGWLPPEARGRVRHLGFRRDITRILPAMDVMVQPSREDAFPRVVCEAMAAGLPVVGTRSGGMEEQVVDGETGYLAPVGDANAVAQAVLRLLADPDRCRAMGQAGRRRFETHFRLETMSERFLGVLRQARGAALSPAAQSFVEGFVGQWAAQGELLRRLAEEGDGRHRGLGRVGSWLRRLAGRATRKGI